MKRFDIVKLDWEERFGLPSAGALNVGKFSSFILGAILTAVLYGILSLLRQLMGNPVTLAMFFPGGEASRSYVPVITVLMAMWTLSMLIIKQSKLKVQQYALDALPVNKKADNQLTLLEELYDNIENYPAASMLKKRLLLEKTQSHCAENIQLMENAFNDLEKDSENSFIIISCFIWAIPVLGFIGTVLGLARAVSNFGVLSNASGQLDFNAVLPRITGGLATAFETTLIALVFALMLQILSSFQNQREQRWISSVKQHIMDQNFCGDETGTSAEVQ